MYVKSNAMGHYIYYVLHGGNGSVNTLIVPLISDFLKGESGVRLR